MQEKRKFHNFFCHGSTLLGPRLWVCNPRKAEYSQASDLDGQPANVKGVAAKTFPFLRWRFLCEWAFHVHFVLMSFLIWDFEQWDISGVLAPLAWRYSIARRICNMTNPQINDQESGCQKSICWNFAKLLKLRLYKDDLHMFLSQGLSVSDKYQTKVQKVGQPWRRTCCDWMILCRSEAKYLKWQACKNNSFLRGNHGMLRTAKPGICLRSWEMIPWSRLFDCQLLPCLSFSFTSASNISHLAHVRFNFSHASNPVPLCIHPRQVQIFETEPLLENPKEKGDSHDVVVRAGESGALTNH